MDDAENDLNKMGVRGWRKMAMNRDARKLILKEAKVQPVPYSGVRERERERERETEREGQRDSMQTNAELLFQRRKFHFCVFNTFLPIPLCNLSHHW
jgi:hypothetical protein